MFNEDIIPQRHDFSTGRKTPGPRVHNLCEPVQYLQLFFINAEREKEKVSRLFIQSK